MKDFIYTYTEKLAREKAKWIDDQILSALPEWKRKVLLKTKSRLIAKIIRANIEIESWTLIADFGQEVRIKLNNKVVAKRKFKY